MSIEELEKLRKKTRNIEIIGIILSISIAIMSFIGTRSLICSFIIMVPGLIITTIINSGPQKKFALAYKNTFVLKSLESVFSDLIYEPEKGLDESIIRNTGMMNMGDFYSSNDYIVGKYKGIDVIQADVHILEKRETTDSDGKTTTTWVTIFRGRWMIFDFNKNFKANVQVSQQGFRNSRISIWNSGIKYKKVAMEDQEFNNHFNIYAQDEHDAFYILAPSLMEKIKKLSDDISGRILLCFIDNKLHVGIQNNDDSFEPSSIFTKIDEKKVIQAISNDIKLITDFVDKLNLDNDLFRKEV